MRFGFLNTRSFESEIQGIIRVISVLVLVLLIERHFNIIEDVTIDYSIIPTDFIIVLLFISFSFGLFFSYLHLRWINENRNKKSTLSGSIGFLGLFVNLMISVIQLIEATGNVSLVDDSLLTMFYTIGIILASIGFIAEITRIDEPLIAWFENSKLYTLRLLLSTFSIILMFNYRNIGVNGSIIPFTVGYLLFVVSWIMHKNFRGIITFLSVIVAIWGIYLGISNTFYHNSPENWLIYSLITENIGVSIILWIKEIINTLKSIIYSIYKFIQSLIASIIRFFKKYTILGIRILITIFGVILLIFASIAIPSDYLFLDEIIYRLIGIILVYIMWFNIINIKFENFGKYTLGLAYHAIISLKNNLKGIRNIISVLTVYLFVIGFILLIIEPFSGIIVISVASIIQYLLWFKVVNSQFVKLLNFSITKITLWFKNFKENLQKLLRYIILLTSYIFVLIGPQILSSEKNFGLFNVSRFIGVLIFYLIYKKNINRIFKVILQEIIENILIIAEFVKINYKKIIKIAVIFVGIYLLVLGPAIMQNERNFGLFNISRLFGIILLYSVWFNTINRIMIQNFVKMKNYVKSTIPLIKEHYIEIIRIIVTPISLFVIILAPPLLENEKWLSFSNVSRYLGILLLYIVYFKPANKAIKDLFEQISILFKNSLKKVFFYKIIILQCLISLLASILILIPKNVTNEVDINITRTFGITLIYLAWFVVINGFILSILVRIYSTTTISLKYIIEKRFVIIRAILIMVGLLFIGLGFVDIINGSKNGSMFMIIGIVLNYVSLFREINSAIIDVFESFKNIIKSLYKAISNFFVTIIDQLKQLFITIADSVIIIILIVISLLILFYGIILFTSGIINDWTPILIENIPFLDSIGRMMGDETTLLGLFANVDQFIWLLIGIGFIIVGTVSSLIVYNNRRNLALNITKNHKTDSDVIRKKSQIYNGGDNNV